MIYWIITTSLIQEKSEERERQYTHAISDVIRRCNGTSIKIIILENTSRTESFLDGLGADVLYTTNNSLQTTNYGIKELYDVLACIEKYGIAEEDYIVKMTGRYFLSEVCPFLDEILQLEETKYEALLKYGWWEPSPRTKHANCITGLLCMKCKYVKKIRVPALSEIGTFLEYLWAEATVDIPDEQIKTFDSLGLHINPKCNDNNIFFEV